MSWNAVRGGWYDPWWEGCSEVGSHRSRGRWTVRCRGRLTVHRPSLQSVGRGVPRVGQSEPHGTPDVQGGNGPGRGPGSGPDRPPVRSRAA